MTGTKPKHDAFGWTPHRMLDDLLRDLDDRQGYDVGACDPATMQEWRTEWLRIIRKHIADAAKPKKVTTKFKRIKYGTRGTLSLYDKSIDGSVTPLDLFSLHIGMKPLHVVPCLSLRQFLEIQKTSFDHE